MENPQKAAGIALEMEAGKDRTDLIGNVAGKWATNNPGDALAWASGLENEDERKRAQRSAIGGWADKDPAAAAESIASLDALEAQDAVGEVGSRWARQEPSAAAGWVTQQEEGAGKVRATADVMRNWTATEPENASTWLSAQPAGPSRDSGIVGLADTIGPSDPVASMEWVASISDAEKRTMEINNRVKIWRNIDADAANNWIETSEQLTATDRAALAPKAE